MPEEAGLSLHNVSQVSVVLRQALMGGWAHPGFLSPDFCHPLHHLDFETFAPGQPPSMEECPIRPSPFSSVCMWEDGPRGKPPGISPFAEAGDPQRNSATPCCAPSDRRRYPRVQPELRGASSRSLPATSPAPRFRTARVAAPVKDLALPFARHWY